MPRSGLTLEPWPLASPAAVLAWGVTASVSIVLGVPPWLAFVLGACVWGAVVAEGWLRPPSWRRPALWRLRDPWRGAVADAIHSLERFEQIIAVSGDDVVRARLESMTPRVVDAVSQTWAVAVLGLALDDDVRRLRTALARPVRSTSTAGEPGAAELATARAVAVDGARAVYGRLRQLEAQFGEVIARAAELTIAGDPLLDTFVLDPLDHVTIELEALRLALAEVRGITA